MYKQVLLLAVCFQIINAPLSARPFSWRTLCVVVPYGGALIALGIYVHALRSVGKRQRVEIEKTRQGVRKVAGESRRTYRDRLKKAVKNLKEELKERFVLPLRRARKARSVMISFFSLGTFLGFVGPILRALRF